MIVIKKLKKIYEYIMTKFKVLLAQKTFIYDDIEVKYLYSDVKNSDSLVVVFSACTRQGIKARYNYVKTLDNINCSRLYILDDFGPDGRGSYYLGHMPEFKELEAVTALINKFINWKRPDQLLFCGSCKGAYAALNIGTSFSNSIIIIGEPTYRIATEFSLEGELMQYWMGEVNKDNIDIIDYYLTNRLKQNSLKDTQTIYYYYSNVDEYIDRHTKPLLSDLKSFGYNVFETVGEFTRHGELGIYFAPFLKNNVKQIVNSGVDYGK